MEMPQAVTDILIANKDGIWASLVTTLWSAAGGIVAVLMHPPEKPPMTTREIWGTIFIGTMMGIAFGSIIGEVVNVPFEKSMPIGATAMLAGMMGRKIAKRILSLSVIIGGKEEKA